MEDPEEHDFMATDDAEEHDFMTVEDVEEHDFMAMDGQDYDNDDDDNDGSSSFSDPAPEQDLDDQEEYFDWDGLKDFRSKIEYVIRRLVDKKRVWCEDPEDPDAEDDAPRPLQGWMVDWLGETGTDPTGTFPTALHWFAVQGPGNMPDPKTSKKMIHWLIGKNPDALRKEDKKKGRPLQLAIETRTRNFVDWVIDFFLPADPDGGREDGDKKQDKKKDIESRRQAAELDAILGLPGYEGRNCIHEALANYPEVTLKLVNAASPATLCQRDDHGNTALHCAMKYSLCYCDDRKYLAVMGEDGREMDKVGHLSVVEAIVKKSDLEMQRKRNLGGGSGNNTFDVQFNNENMSPLGVFDQTMAEEEEKIEKEEREKDKKAANKKEDGAKILEMKQLKMRRAMAKAKKKQSGLRETQNENESSTKESHRAKKREATKGGRDRQTMMMMEKNGSGKEPRRDPKASSKEDGGGHLKSSKYPGDSKAGIKSASRKGDTSTTLPHHPDELALSQGSSKPKASAARDHLKANGRQRDRLGLTIQTELAGFSKAGDSTGAASSPAVSISARPNMSAPRQPGPGHAPRSSVPDNSTKIQRLERRRTGLVDGADTHKHPEKRHKEKLPIEQEEERIKQQLEEHRKKKKEKRIKTAEAVKDWLKVHYLLNRPDLEARKLLYGPTDPTDKNLFFDATWYEKKPGKEIAGMVEDLANVGGFDTTLSYVTLPIIHREEKIRAESRQSEQDKDKDGGSTPKFRENPWIGRDGLVGVLQTLANKGVERILRLTVDDMEAPSHTDESIEKALTGRDLSNPNALRAKSIQVDTWDWRRLDVPSEVLRWAAPNVRILYLYWSGNVSVLKDWASVDGLARLPKLKEIHLTVYPGMESQKRTNHLVEDFVRKFNNKANGPTVYSSRKYEPPTGLGNTAPETSAGTHQDDSQEEDHWIKTMESFRAQFVNAIKAYSRLPNSNYDSVKPIKVALIDDGVDLGELETYGAGRKVTGMSFFPSTRAGNNNCHNVPWYTSSGGHGTAMANMIFKINPYVQLHVMKLHDGTKKGNRTIHASSAAQAIRAATGMKVNIISMSWTIKNGSDHDHAGGGGGGSDPAIQELKDALEQAKKSNILMFCSASDDRTESAHTLPYSCVPGSIFRIGAADVFGQRDLHVNDSSSIHYYFPGNNVAEKSSRRLLLRPSSSSSPSSASRPAVKYHDGSSVSTALAAGLAALIMHMASINAAEARADQNKSKREKDKAESCAEFLQAHVNMNAVFKMIESQGDAENKKYLPVWNWFKKYAEDIKNAPMGARKVAVICELITGLTGTVGVTTAHR